MNSIDHIHRMLVETDDGTRRFPPTLLYNEGWLLRLIVDWYCRHPQVPGTLQFHAGAEWYSEALLASPFLRGQYREGYTHADAVIGHFDVRKERGDIELKRDATQFVVVEAKMGSPLSAGTKHASDYNQAARNIACMVKLIESRAADSQPLMDTRFIVLAPESKLREHQTHLLLDKAHLGKVIRARAESRGAADIEWCDREVIPRLSGEQLRSVAISWETILAEIVSVDPAEGRDLMEFYRACREHNRIRDIEGDVERHQVPSASNA